MALFGKVVKNVEDVAWRGFQAVNQRIPEGRSLEPSWAPGPLPGTELWERRKEQVTTRVFGAVSEMRSPGAYLNYPGSARRLDFVPPDFGTVQWIDDARSHLACGSLPASPVAPDAPNPEWSAS